MPVSRTENDFKAFGTNNILKIYMKVAVLFSGGKDSTQAVKWCLDNGHEVSCLISVKPKDGTAYLWHYPTVEWTVLQAEAMGIPLILLKCEKIGSKVEADELRKVFGKIKVDAVVLGGVGLQRTQIKEVQRVAKEYGIDTLVPYGKLTSEQLLTEEINSGLKIVMTDVATDGLGIDWIGKPIDSNTFEELKWRSEKFGFDILLEGGSGNTFVVDAPFFKKRIEFKSVEKVWDNATSSGYLKVNDAVLVPKTDF